MPQTDLVDVKTFVFGRELAISLWANWIPSAISYDGNVIYTSKPDCKFADNSHKFGEIPNQMCDDSCSQT